jgi:CHAT domain-containing protein
MEYSAAWLNLAIFLAWSDQLPASMEAYSQYTRGSAGQPVSPQIRSNRLLYQSLSLFSMELNKQAADSLISSIAARPSTGIINKILLADSYGLLARLYKKTGDLFESSRNFERSVNLNRQLDRTLVMAGELADMSSVLSTIDRSDRKADSVLLEALAIYTKIDSLPAVAQVLNELGVLFNRRGNIRESLRNFMESLDVKSRIPGLSKQEFVVVINNIGHCYQNLGNSDSARRYFSKAADYAKLSGRNPAPYYANLGANYGSNEDYGMALEYFQKALNSLDPDCSETDLSSNPRISRVTPQLADFTAFKAHTYHRRHHQLHNPDDLVAGLQTFMIALEMIDTLRFMYSFESKPYLSSEAKIHFFNALDMALDLYELTGNQDYLQLAFQLSERNKSATLNEFLRTNKARAYMGNLAPWIRKEDSIKQIINNLSSNLITLSQSTVPDAESTTAFKLEISDLTDELRAIGISARRENPDYFKMVYQSSSYRPGEIMQMILPGEALIDYTVVRDNRLSLDYMTILVLTSDTLYTYRDTLPNQFRDEINDFRNSITSYVDSKVFQDFSRLSHLMYLYFFKPIEKFRDIDKLIVLPDEELGFLPFEVFVADTIKPKASDFRKLNYLNRHYQISYISSHEQLVQFRTGPEKSENSTIYAFAPFSTHGVKTDTIRLAPLENSGTEVRDISKFFRTRIFKDKRAGEQTLRHAFQQESIINLSTHGIMNTGNPMQSRLLLNPSEPDGSLYLFEMMSLKIKSPMVILNACNTGTGKLQVGEGIMSMARGFQYAGVSSVITTLWPVDDQSSAIIMKHFFQNLYDGLDQREALMKARNTYIDQATKATGAPYFWAGQVLIGDTGKLSISHHATTLKLIISIILATVIIISSVLLFKKLRD